MVSQGVVDLILSLLADGQLSQRKIARSVGVSRGTIGAIAKGHRPRTRTTEERWSDPTRSLGPPVRCGGCGGLIYMPCLLCRVREHRAAELARLRASSQCNNSHP